MIFVFGSNLAGRHGRGAALAARETHGAILGEGEGRQGMSYAIPTKDYNIRTLPLWCIAEYVQRFLEYARANPELTFHVTNIGCGLAGYKPHEVAPMFQGAPDNCVFTPEFEEHVRGHDVPLQALREDGQAGRHEAVGEVLVQHHRQDGASDPG
jgi:hypothetical protein